VSAPRSLRARIVLAAVAALAFSGLVAGVALLEAIERDGRDSVDQELEERAETVAGGPSGGPGPAEFGAPDESTRFPLPPPPPDGGGPDARGGPPGRGERLLAGSGTFVQVSLDGQVLARRGDVPDEPPEVPEEDGFDTLDIGEQQWRSLTVTPERGPLGDLRFQLLSSLEPVEDRVASIRWLVLILGLGALALTGAAAWLTTSLAVRPLARLRAGAARVTGTKDLATRLPEDEGPEEVRSLAQTLNEMLSRLRASTDAMERALAATRRFAGDAGHELRTPLTGMRANLDTLERNPDLSPGERRTLVQETIAEQDRIVHLLDGLQALARGEAVESLAREEVDLTDVLDSAVHAARKRHPGASYALEERIEEGSVRGWPGGLRLLVDNLLDNAALHGGRGANVRVDLRRDDGSLLVRVDDDGPGIPEEERGQVLEPFTRGASAEAPGTGLGLAIVSQQVALHGGRLRLDESSLGGLAVEVRLPPAESS
jgi:two-component system, OmpR family, sensor histidine kinase PrrB